MIIHYLFWFPIIWVLSFLCHELMHACEHARQTGRRSIIEIWFPYRFVPSMRVIPRGILTDPDMFYLAGGLYTSLIHLFTFFGYLACFGFQQTGFLFSITCIGLVQFMYGYFEMSYIRRVDRDIFMIGHYILYFLVVSIFFIVWVIM